MRFVSPLAGLRNSHALVVAFGIALVPIAAGVAIGASAEPAGALPAPYGPARNGDIAYSKDGDIWTVDASGEHPQVLIADPAQDTYPYYSPDGTRFIFERREDGQPARIMVAAADGTGVAEVADIRPDWWWSDWSPDSESVLVVWSEDGEEAISILSTDGSGMASTIDLGGLIPDFAAWRPPDGREIVFVGYEPSHPTERGIYGVAPDGSGLRQIGEADTDLAFQQPSLSSDGTRIAYWNWEEGQGAQNNLYTRNLANGETQALMLDPEYPGSGTAPRFSPDGESIVFDTAAPDGMDGAQLVLGPVDQHVLGHRIGTPYAYGEWADIAWDFSPDGSTVLLNWSVSDTEAGLNASGENHLIDVATGQATKASEWMFGPSWQRLAP